jgi:methylmalonyl-CoA mutase N-terminal domain/subunit
VLAYESGVAASVDPLAGSYHLESLTNELEARVVAGLAEIEGRGGTLQALADGYQQGEIGDAAYEFQRQVEAGERIVVGVNAFGEGGEEQKPAPQQIDSEAERRQVARTRAVRESRDATAAAATLEALEAAARGTENVLPRIRACVEARVTLGEISDALRRAWGEHRP